MKRTARLDKAGKHFRQYTLNPPINLTGVEYATAAIVQGSECTLVSAGRRDLLLTPEKISDADALSRIGYTLERPAPELVLGEARDKPGESDLYWVESDNYTGKVFYDSDNCCKHPGGNWQCTTYYRNATWRLITVKEPQP